MISIDLPPLLHGIYVRDFFSDDDGFVEIFFGSHQIATIPAVRRPEFSSDLDTADEINAVVSETVGLWLKDRLHL